RRAHDAGSPGEPGQPLQAMTAFVISTDEVPNPARKEPTYDNGGFVNEHCLRNVGTNALSGRANAVPQTKSSLHEKAAGEETTSPKDKRLLARLRRKAWLLPLFHTQFWVSAAFSLIQPFYPHLAADAGLEAWKYGFVFSTYKMAMLAASLSSDRLMNLLSPLKVWACGLLGFFLFTLIFGSLYWSPGGNTLLGISLGLVVMGGFTQVLYIVSIYSVVTSKFPHSTGLIIAAFECVWGIGNMAGSIIGGVLIDVWAFPLPFYVTGVIMVLPLPFIIKGGTVTFLEPKAAPEAQDTPHPRANMKFRRLLWDSVFITDIITLMLSWVIMGFNEPTLEPYLVQFHLSSTEVGTVFMVQFVSYAAGAVISGLLCHFKVELFFSFAAQLMTVLAYLILGPAPFISTLPTLWMVYLSQVLTGVGMAGQFVCSFCHALKYCIARGYPDDVRTSGFVSSVVFTFLVFGAMTTPPIAGHLVSTYGYRKGSMFLFAILALWTPVTLFQWLRSVCTTRIPTSATTVEQGT
ncbi:unnamed protein product, partial [Ixodes hexagonus]